MLKMKFAGEAEWKVVVLAVLPSAPTTKRPERRLVWRSEDCSTGHTAVPIWARVWKCCEADRNEWRTSSLQCSWTSSKQMYKWAWIQIINICVAYISNSFFQQKFFKFRQSITDMRCAKVVFLFTSKHIIKPNYTYSFDCLIAEMGQKSFFCFKV